MRMPLRMSGERGVALICAMEDADPGETVPYHVGQLLFDRVGDPILSNVANHALNLAVHGYGVLVQRVTHKLWIDERYTEFEYRYIAAAEPPETSPEKRRAMHHLMSVGYGRQGRGEVVSL